MSSPLPVLQISSALEQKVAPLLDLSDPKAAGAQPHEPRVLTRALAAVAIWEHAGCTLEEAADSIVDGGDDGGIDAIYAKQDPPYLFIAQSKWRSNGNATLDSNAVLKLREGFENLAQGKLDGLNSRIKSKWDRSRQVMLDPDCKIVITVALLGDDAVHPDQRRGLEKIGEKHGDDNIDYRYLHLRDFREIVRHGIATPAVELKVQLVESFHRKRTDARLESYVGSVRSQEVYEWVERYGRRLYDQNIRGSLGNTTVNEQIRATLQNKPEMFWDLNKGITVVTNQIKRAPADSGTYSSPAHLTLPRASIVDGAQTAASIHRVLAKLDGRGRSSEAEVPIKIISLQGASPDLAKKIAIAANTQNAIFERDLVSNDDVQERLNSELDFLGKRYVYKRSTDLALPGDDTCSIDEVALALTCQQSNAGLVGRVKGKSDTLWEQGDGSIYGQIFSQVPHAQFAWNCVIFMRTVEERMKKVTAARKGRAVGIAENAHLLVGHILFRMFDETALQDSSEQEIRPEIDKAANRCQQILDYIIHHSDLEYGHDAYPRTTFGDERRCKVLASRVLSDLRSQGAQPQLRSTDQQRMRARASVEYIIDGGLLAQDTILQFRSSTKARRAQFEAALESAPATGKAIWTNNRRRPLIWESDSQHYAPSALAAAVIEKVTGTKPRAVRGPDCWVAPDGRTLTELADEVKRREADASFSN